MIGSKLGSSYIKGSAHSFTARLMFISGPSWTFKNPLINVSLQVGQSTHISPAYLLSQDMFPKDLVEPGHGVFTVLESICFRADYGLTDEYKALLEVLISNTSSGLFRLHRFLERNPFGK